MAQTVGAQSAGGRTTGRTIYRHPVPTVSDSSRRTRQYVALGMLVLLYLGGIIGWSCAALRVEPPTTSTADTTVSAEPAPNPDLGDVSHESMSVDSGGM